MGLPVHLALIRPSAGQGEEAGHPVASRAGLDYGPCREPYCVLEALLDVAVACQGVAQILVWPSFRFVAYPPRWICGLRLSSLHYGMRFLAGNGLVGRDGLGEVHRHYLGQQLTSCDKARWTAGVALMCWTPMGVAVSVAKGGVSCRGGRSTRLRGGARLVATEAIAVDGLISNSRMDGGRESRGQTEQGNRRAMPVIRTKADGIKRGGCWYKVGV